MIFNIKKLKSIFRRFSLDGMHPAVIFENERQFIMIQ